NEEIEIQLRLHSLRAKKEINVLLLGAGGSDQSKLLRQIRLLHDGGYSTGERAAYKEIIFTNIVQEMRAVLQALPQLDISLAPQNDAHRAVILSLPAQIDDVLPSDIADAIRGLWRDPGVKEAVRRRGEFLLNDDVIYHFNSIDRLGKSDYLPTDQDILRSRVQKTGLSETCLQVGELTYKFLDPSDQRSERKKWIHCFENVTAILFCASLSDYDQMLYEDESVNRLEDSLREFDSICNSRWFVKTNIILFLNIDEFSEKLERSPPVDHFPDYTGGANYNGGANYDAACDYFLHRFVSLNQSAASRQIYVHYVSTTDTQLLNYVTRAIQDILLQIYLRGLKLL
ncbi:putative guanine nucleotide-binding protein alpha-1 subunit, partial [Mycena capillaripes]